MNVNAEAAVLEAAFYGTSLSAIQDQAHQGQRYQRTQHPSIFAAASTAKSRLRSITTLIFPAGSKAKVGAKKDVRVHQRPMAQLNMKQLSRQQDQSCSPSSKTGPFSIQITLVWRTSGNAYLNTSRSSDPKNLTQNARSPSRSLWSLLLWKKR